MAEADATRWSLILGAAEGRPLDRETFSIRYAPVIAAYLGARWRLPQEHEAVQDAAQDVMVECFKDGGALSRVDPARNGGFRAYLFGIVRNVALMAERRLARRRDQPLGQDFDADQMAADDASLSRVFDRAFAVAVTRQARELMARRSTRSPAAALRFQALGLQFENGLPPREVAVAMQMPVERIYELLKEARRDYRDALLEVVRLFHPDDSPAALEQACRDLLQLLQ